MPSSSPVILPRPLPTIEGISTMPWWAPLAGLTGAVAVFAGQDRGRTGEWADYRGEPLHFACYRPLRLDEHAGARPERLARHWRCSHGGRHCPCLSVLMSNRDSRFGCERNGLTVWGPISHKQIAALNKSHKRRLWSILPLASPASQARNASHL